MKIRVKYYVRYVGDKDMPGWYLLHAAGPLEAAMLFYHATCQGAHKDAGNVEVSENPHGVHALVWQVQCPEPGEYGFGLPRKPEQPDNGKVKP